MQNRSLALVVPCALLALAAFSQVNAPLEKRIAHYDLSKMRPSTAVHGGAGGMQFGVLLNAGAVPNLLFLHRGIINPHSSIGEHYHMRCEEMFVILDGEAEFTVDGHTSLIKGPVAVPDRMGHAHAIYNPGDKPIQWMNINVGMGPNYDTFDLGDTRIGAPLEPIPQFPSMRFDRTMLRPTSAMDGGQGTVAVSSRSRSNDLFDAMGLCGSPGHSAGFERGLARAAGSR
jgi:hypothetical protein